MKSTQPTHGLAPTAPDAKGAPASVSPRERPFKELGADALIRTTQAAARKKDYVAATYCHQEAEHRRKRTKGRVARALRNGAIEPIEWLREAEAVALAFRKQSTGKHHVYIVLLRGPFALSKYGVYVGETSHTPETRFEQHKVGYKAARSVRSRGKCLLPHLYAHLNPLAKTEAKVLEARLGEAFKAAGIPTRGGH